MTIIGNVALGILFIALGFALRRSTYAHNPELSKYTFIFMELAGALFLVAAAIRALK